MDLEFLRKIGLTEGEIKVYNALLEAGTSGLSLIHEKTAIERRNIYDILTKLIEKGLVSYIVEKGKKRFQITHPNKILDFLDEKRRDIETIETEIKPQIPNLIQVFNENKPEIRAEIFRGNEAIKALLNEALEYDKNYWMGGNAGLDQYFPYWWKHYNKKRIEKKVFWYDLADYGFYLSTYKKPKTYKNEYYELRFLPKDLISPMVLFLYQNKVSQILWGKKSFAFVLELSLIHI